jgi:arylsulfatase A-like enzyme
MSKPNLIIFLPETIRADAVTGPQEGRAITPNFDRLNEQGVTFTNAFAQMAFCTPSRCSMFTGLYPHTHGHRSIWHLLQNGERNLFQDLKEAGYYNVVYGKNDLIDKTFVDKCFDETQPRESAVEKITKNNNIKKTKYTDKLYNAFYHGCVEGNVYNMDDAWIDSALEFMDEDHLQPWCLFLPLNYAHPAYEVEEPFFSMHNRNKVAAPLPAGELTNKRLFKKLDYQFYGSDKLTEDDFREIKAVYYGMVSRVDKHLGMILDKVEQKGLTDNTVVCASSDHGDYAGDYGLVEKYLVGFEDCLLNVPLMFRVPGAAASQIDNLCEMVDIYPTLLELAGVPSKHFHFGKSLIGLMRGDTKEHRDAVFAEGGVLPNEEHFQIAGLAPGNWYTERGEEHQKHKNVSSRAIMIRTKKYKYSYSTEDIDELFDLRNDPEGINNVAELPEYQKIKQELKEHILQWIVNTSDTLPIKAHSEKERMWR